MRSTAPPTTTIASSRHTSASAAIASARSSDRRRRGLRRRRARLVGRGRSDSPTSSTSACNASADVADDRLAHRRASRLDGIARDRDQRRPLGQQRPGHVRVVGEHRRADDEHQVVAGRASARAARSPAAGHPRTSDGPPGTRSGCRRSPGGAHTGSRCFTASATAASQPPAASISGPATSIGLRADSSRRRELREPSGSGPARPLTTGARVERPVRVGLGVPVVHRDRDERRTARRQRGVVDRASQRGRDVLRARRLVAPLDVRLRADGRVAVGQQCLDG